MLHDDVAVVFEDFVRHGDAIQRDGSGQFAKEGRQRQGADQNRLRSSANKQTQKSQSRYTHKHVAQYRRGRAVPTARKVVAGHRNIIVATSLVLSGWPKNRDKHTEVPQMR